MGFLYRAGQVRAYWQLRHATAPDVPEDARKRLTEPMLHQFRILTPADQLHSLSVYRELIALGAEDDTITAGLIHDVGKGCAKCRITIADRVLHVVGRRFLPGPYEAFARRETAPSRLRSVHRLANHAERGALAASQAGYSERVIDLVRWHEHGGHPTDRELHLLRQADQAKIRPQ